MKNVCFVAVIMLMGFSLLGADPKFQYDIPFRWASPELKGQGDSATAYASGFNSLMTNPAGFAFNRNVKYTKGTNGFGEIEYARQEKDEITIVSILPWLMLDFFSPIETDIGNTEGIINTLFHQVTENGMGAGLHLGGGYVGNGLGVGLVSSVDVSVPQSRLVTTVNGSVTATLALVGGYAYKFKLGPIDLSVGANIRPMWRVKLREINASTLFEFIAGEDRNLGAIDTISGWAIGFDAGTLVQWRSLTLGLSFRDIGHTRYQYKVANLESNELSPFTGEPQSDLDYITPMTMRVGLSFQPDLAQLRRFIDPKVHFDYTFHLVNDADVRNFHAGTFWTNLNVGAEVKFFNIVSIRSGFSGGYLSAGLGFDLFIAELNAAIFSEEQGFNAGQGQQLGASAELVFRF